MLQEKAERPFTAEKKRNTQLNVWFGFFYCSGAPRFEYSPTLIRVVKCGGGVGRNLHLRDDSVEIDWGRAPWKLNTTHRFLFITQFHQGKDASRRICFVLQDVFLLGLWVKGEISSLPFQEDDRYTENFLYRFFIWLGAAVGDQHCRSLQLSGVYWSPLKHLLN